MIYNKAWYSFAAILLIFTGLLLAYGCSKQPYDSINKGESLQFQEGHPEFHADAIAILSKTESPILHIVADISHESLIFKKRGEKIVARANLEVRITKDTNGSSEQIFVKNYNIDVTAKGEVTGSNQKYYAFSKKLPVSPGEYTIRLSVEDMSSNKTTSQTLSTSIPAIDENQSVLANIQLFGKTDRQRSSGYQLLTRYNIPGRYDSLKIKFQVNHGTSADTLYINSELQEFYTDTTIAAPMGHYNYSPSSIQYKGIEYDQYDIIHTTSRQIAQEGLIDVEFRIPNLKQGNYRFSVRLSTSSQPDHISQKARDFAIRSEYYPIPTTPRELARPLAYLMENKNYNQLMSIEDPDSLKAAIDQFWLSNIPDKQKASDVIEKYYQRVETSNKMFTNFKKGWKTDPGMIYILFGSPLFVDYHVKRMIWFYSYDRTNERKRFTFDQPTMNNRGFPFEHYILQRGFGYNSIEYQQVRLWRSGEILSTPF